jgi:delta24(24(1))-sterol reductase
MYFEKWGFMLIFWNLAGVPLTYIHCTLYIANHDPSESHWNPYLLTLLFLIYLFVYWIWDTANSQKNMFRAQERGVELNRKTFPQLPWKSVKNPKSIKTKTGDSILCDGWCEFFCFPFLSFPSISSLSSLPLIFLSSVIAYPNPFHRRQSP